MKRSYSWPLDLHSHVNVFLRAIIGAAEPALQALAQEHRLLFSRGAQPARNPDGTPVSGLFNSTFTARAGMRPGFDVQVVHDRSLLSFVHVRAELAVPEARPLALVAGLAALFGYYGYLFFLPSPEPLYPVNGVGILGGWALAAYLTVRHLEERRGWTTGAGAAGLVVGAVLALAWPFLFVYVAVRTAIVKLTEKRGGAPIIRGLEAALVHVDAAVASVMPMYGPAPYPPPPLRPAGFAAAPGFAPAPPPAVHVPRPRARYPAPPSALPGGTQDERPPCPECGFPIEPGAATCPACGLSLVWN